MSVAPSENSDLVAFLRARLDEDEKAAADARDDVESWWQDPAQDSPAELHIVRHSPERVLREVEAARRVLDMWQDPDTIEESINYAVSSADYQIASADTVDRIVRVMALPYAAHPDFRPEWTA